MYLNISTTVYRKGKIYIKEKENTFFIPNLLKTYVKKINSDKSFIIKF